MLVGICFVLIFAGCLYAAYSGTLPAVSDALLQSPSETLSLIWKLCGPICLFSGLMRVAEASGLVARISRFLARPLRFLMPKTAKDPELRDAVGMNLSANFLGLGNAATPYGIRACGRMTDDGMGRSLAVFLILNTCSVQLIPTTVCALRQAHGAAAPMSILPAVWTVQILSCGFGILLICCFFRRHT